MALMICGEHLSGKGSALNTHTKHRRRNGGKAGGFNCRHCGRAVDGDACGTAHRNHCPWCLWSVHVDDRPGDRQACCGGTMEPIAVWAKRDGEWAIVHRCTACGTLRTNRIAGDDSTWGLLALATRAISQPPFPID